MRRGTAPSAVDPRIALLRDLAIDVILRSRAARKLPDKFEDALYGHRALGLDGTDDNLDLAVDLIDWLVKLDGRPMEPTAYDHTALDRAKLARFLEIGQLLMRHTTR